MPGPEDQTDIQDALERMGDFMRLSSADEVVRQTRVPQKQDDPLAVGRDTARTRPALSRPTTLPFRSMSWEVFEKFCMDFVKALPNVQDASLYGGQGYAQRGIDLTATTTDGAVWAFQCKQRSRAGSADVLKAVEAQQFPASRNHLVVSCKASPAARDEIGRHQGWQLWDMDDLSSMIRELPEPARSNLIETFFGAGWRWDFLGTAGYLTFLTADNYFEITRRPGLLFDHSLQLVGRQEAVEELDAFVTDPGLSVAMVGGPGGIGKSRLLLAFATSEVRTHSTYEVRFLAESAAVDLKAFDELPPGEVLIVVEDAHRLDDLDVLLAGARRRLYPTKVVLTFRPQGYAALRAALVHAGFDTTEVKEPILLGPLVEAEVSELAALVLDADDHLVHLLAAATKDCPLVTVVGGRLLARKQVDPRLLERDADFRYTVLSRFQDELLGNVSASLSAEFIRRVLQTVSAIEPVRPADSHMIEKISLLIGGESHSVITALGDLEAAGVLRRRGRTLRITPDVLADNVLHTACLTESGQPTGFAEIVFQQFLDTRPGAVLRNLGELDWRIRLADGKPYSLLGSIWDGFIAAFSEADAAQRVLMLGLLSEVAYFQPDRTLEIVELALNGLDLEQAVAELSAHESNDAEVLRRAARVLRDVSYSMEHTRRSCELLWIAGRDDPRPLNSTPEHPIRILTDLAGYDPAKPLDFNRIVLDSALSWLVTDEASHLHSAFEVIKALLGKEGYSTQHRGAQMVMSSFAVSYAATKDLRVAALEAAFGSLTASEVQLATRALDVVISGLMPPMGLFGRSIPSEELNQWVPEQEAILRRLATIDWGEVEPTLVLKVDEQLNWLGQRRNEGSLPQLAEEVLKVLPNDWSTALTTAISRYAEKHDAEAGFEENKQKTDALRKSAAEGLVERYPDPISALAFVESRIAAIQYAGETAQPGQLLALLPAVSPPFAFGIASELVTRPDKWAIRGYFGALLYGIGEFDAAEASALARRAVESQDIVLGRAVGHSYAWLQPSESGRLVADIELVHSLLAHVDPATRALAIRSTGQLYGQRDDTVERLLAVEVGAEQQVGSALAALFGPHGPIPVGALTEEQLEDLISKFDLLPALDAFEVQQFLGEVAGVAPVPVIDLLLRRIEASEAATTRDFQPLPYHWAADPFAPIRSTPAYPEALVAVRNQSLRDSWQARWWVPQLFEALVGDFDDVVLATLAEWIDSENDVRIRRASDLLRNANPDFVFDHAKFVGELLNKAAAISTDCVLHVRSSLAASALGGIRSGTPGEPMPEDVRLRKRADEAASSASVGGSAHAFFAALATDLRRSIADQLASDEELFD